MPDSNPIDALGLDGSADDIAKQMFGYMGWALDDPDMVDPDTGVNVLREAAAGGWSTDMLKGALAKTVWWKTKSDAERNWQNTVESDPASAARQINDKATSIRDELIQLGVNLDDSAIRNFASDALRFGWSETQLKLALDAELQRSPSVLQSKVGSDFKALARQFATPMSDQTIQTWAAHAISGNTSDELYRQYLVSQAKARYQDPVLAKFLDAGGTVDQYADPYKQMASQLLGIDSNEIDFSDPKWAAAINVKGDDGKVRSMNYDEWSTYLKQNDTYGWQNTQDGKQQAQQFVDSLGKAFGRVA